MNIDENFVPFDLSMELKSIGFNEDCFAWYNYGGDYLCIFGDDHLLDGYAGSDQRPMAPLWQQAFKWFDINYNLEGSISKDVWYSMKYTWTICGGKNNIRPNGGDSLYHMENNIEYDTYEIASYNCLLELIKIIKNN